MSSSYLFLLWTQYQNIFLINSYIQCTYFYDFTSLVSRPLRSYTMKKLIEHSSLWLCKWFSSSPVFIFSQKLFWLGIGILCFSFPFLVWPVREIIKMISNSYGVPLQKSNINHLIFLYTLENKKEIKKSKNTNHFMLTFFGLEVAPQQNSRTNHDVRCSLCQ